MTLAQMETVVPGLYASAPEPMPFGRDLVMRAFLLQRPAGNVLIYSSPSAGAGADELGGIWRQYLNHWHEAMFAAESVAAPLFCHAADRAHVAERAAVRAAFSRRHMLDDDLEVIPTPGHTPGATAYLWDTGEHRCLFTGDTILLRGDDWRAAVLDSSDRAAYLESLVLMRELDFDVLVPWVATAGGPHHLITDRVGARRRIDAIIARVERGASG